MSHPEIEVRKAARADNQLLAERGARTFHDTFATDGTPEDMAIYLMASFSLAKQAQELADPVSSLLIAQV